MKRRVKLTESDLHRIVRESVNRVLNEIGDTQGGRDYINAAMHKSATQDIKKMLKSKKPRSGGENKEQRKRVNGYMEKGPYGKEWHEEHGKNWSFL